MANQQRSVIVTAIVLAIILGGALVWLLNRTPAEQLATQVPNSEQTGDNAQNSDQAGSEALISVDEANRLAQAQQPSLPTGATGISPTDAATQPQSTAGGQIQGVTATAPTGPAENALVAAFALVLLGSAGLLTLVLPRLQRLGS